MTILDRTARIPGYFASPWPVECGGNRRQKAAKGGLFAKGARASVTTRQDALWHVMTIRRGPGEIFAGGMTLAWTGPEPYGQLERVDPETLRPLACSPRLPAGGHVWCGAIAVHENGDIYKINGCYMHRLDPDCQIVTERRLPIDRAHNGLLMLADGSIVTKDLRLAGQGPCHITRLAPDTLEPMGPPLVLPEGSMGRIAGDLTDDGDIDSLRAIYGVHPNGRFSEPSMQLSWRRPAPWLGRQRLLRISLETGETEAIAPFDAPGGGVIAPPVNVPELGICIAWDSINGGVAGIATGGPRLEVAWRLDARPSMQPVVFPETGELVINDFRTRDDRLLVVDIATGEVLSDVATGSPVGNGMFLTPGGERDIYYCSTFALAWVRWR